MRAAIPLLVIFLICGGIILYCWGYVRGQAKERQKTDLVRDFVMKMEAHIEMAEPEYRPELEAKFFNDLSAMVKS